MREKLSEILQKVLKVPSEFNPFGFNWYIEALRHIEDIVLEGEEGLKVVAEVVEEWARWREKNVEIGLLDKLWEIRKEIWETRVEKYGWEYGSTGVLREFMHELTKGVSERNIWKVAEIFRLIELAMKKDGKATVKLLIDYIDHYYGDIDALRIGLERILHGGEVMDRKELLLRLCEELTKAVEYLYGEDAGLKAHLGEVLGRYGSLLGNIGWAITWADEEVQDKVFRVIEEAFRKHEEHRLKCRLEEWLSWKVGEVIESAFEDKGEEKETQQTQTPTDTLPF
jgi:hypothetical protein